jgi:hypothetical protein
MEMCYDGALVMPSSYAVMNEEEMSYVEGGFVCKSSTFAKAIDISVTVILAVAGIWSAGSLIGEILRRNSKGAIMVLTKTALKYAGVSLASSILTGIYSIISAVSKYTLGNGLAWCVNHFDKDPSYNVIRF